MASLADDNAQLRKDNAALRLLVDKLESTIVSLQSALEAQTAAFQDQRQAIEKLQQELEQLQKRILGPKTEKMPSPRDENRRRQNQKADPDKTKAKRKANAQKRARAETKRVEHTVADEDRHCPKCGQRELPPLGSGRVTKLWQYIPGYFICEEHVQETLSCTCGEHIVTAPGPRRPFEGSRYGASFIAHLIVAKCVDSIPLHRLERRFERLGIPMSRSTMTELFHRAAEELEPLVLRLFAMVAAAPVVQADETSIKIQDRQKRGFIWTFVTPNAIAYRCTPDRSGITPQEVLGGTEGILVVDGYTGYNRVVGVHGRTRAGCLAHARRKFFESLNPVLTWVEPHSRSAETIDDNEGELFGIVLFSPRVVDRQRFGARTVEHIAFGAPSRAQSG